MCVSVLILSVFLQLLPSTLHLGPLQVAELQCYAAGYQCHPACLPMSTQPPKDQGLPEDTGSGEQTWHGWVRCRPAATPVAHLVRPVVPQQDQEVMVLGPQQCLPADRQA